MRNVDMVLQATIEVGESPVWDEESGSLWWVDLLRGELHRLDRERRGAKIGSVRQSLGFIVPFEPGSFVAGVRDGIGILTEDGRFNLVRPIEADRPGFRMNDGKCDRQGRLWAGTMSDASHQHGRLYRVSDDWTEELFRDEMGVPNGLGWSPRGDIMYLADTGAKRLEIWAYDTAVGRPTTLLQAVVFGENDGGPDGLTVDLEGCAWVCLWGGHQIRRYAPSGDLLESVEIPAWNVASCVFGGSNYRDLYVTTARYGLSPAEINRWPLSGSIFRIRPDVGGYPADMFHGVSGWPLCPKRSSGSTM